MTECEETIEHLIQILDSVEMHFDDETVLTGDPVALDDLWQRLRKVDHFRQLTGGGANADVHRDGQTQRGGIQLETIAANDAGFFESEQSLLGRRRGHPDSSRQLRNRCAGIGLQQTDDLQVTGVFQ